MDQRSASQRHIAVLFDSATAGPPIRLVVDLMREPHSALWIIGDPWSIERGRDLAAQIDPTGSRFRVIEPLEATRDADELLDRVLSGIVSLASRGHPHVYLLVVNGWGAPGWPAPEDLLWFDARLTSAIADLPAFVICGYDAARLPARALLYGSEVHEVVYRHGLTLNDPRSLDDRLALVERLTKLPWLDLDGGTGKPLHIGAFYHGTEDLYAQLGRGIANGIVRGEKAIHFIDPAARADHEERLTRLGVDVGALAREGRLDIRTWDDLYLLEGYFDVERQLELMQRLVAEPRPRIRLAANMSWALQSARDSRDLIDYEARLNPLLDRYSHTVICAYDLDRFDPSTVLGAIRTHPIVLIDGKLQENSLYDPELARSASS
jgi:DcmR-like sensory protein